MIEKRVEPLEFCVSKAQDNNGVILFPDISTYSVDYQDSTPINLGHNFLIAYQLEQSNYIYLVANISIDS